MNSGTLSPVDEAAEGWDACLPVNTIAVVVTYGDRVSMAVETLTRVFASGIGTAVLVDNGLRPTVRSELDAQLKNLRGSVLFESLERNEGSAAGFAAGLRRAIDTDAKYIWLLDDDNYPQPRAYIEASTAMNRLRADGRSAAVSCLRTADPSHMRIAAGETTEAVYPQSGEFFGFDLYTRVARLLHRRHNPKPDTSTSVDGKSVKIPVAPYGGLLIATSDIQRVGQPDANFVLYCDDYDFTQRLVRDGVELQLVTAARIDDAGQRWDVQDSNSNMESMVLNTSVWRSYYLYRNLRVLEGRQARHDGKRVRFALNGCVYGALLLARCLRLGKPSFFSLFLEAQADGRRGKLGLKYQLPQ